MSTLKPAVPVKPVVSLILAREDLSQGVISRLAHFFGPPDLVGPGWPFEATSYYAPEMGDHLVRCMVAFLHLRDPGSLAAWKVFANALEASLSLGGRRLVNLDPGYVARERLVLATGKNYSHRLYLGEGIYGDLTLLYGRGGFQALPWSYPDYAERPLGSFLGLVRKKYLWQLKALAHLPQV